MDTNTRPNILLKGRLPNIAPKCPQADLPKADPLTFWLLLWSIASGPPRLTSSLQILGAEQGAFGSLKSRRAEALLGRPALRRLLGHAGLPRLGAAVTGGAPTGGSWRKLEIKALNWRCLKPRHGKDVLQAMLSRSLRGGFRLLCQGVLEATEFHEEKPDTTCTSGEVPSFQAFVCTARDSQEVPGFGWDSRRKSLPNSALDLVELMDVGFRESPVPPSQTRNLGSFLFFVSSERQLARRRARCQRRKPAPFGGRSRPQRGRYSWAARSPGVWRVAFGQLDVAPLKERIHH